MTTTVRTLSSATRRRTTVVVSLAVVIVAVVALALGTGSGSGLALAVGGQRFSANDLALQLGSPLSAAAAASYNPYSTDSAQGGLTGVQNDVSNDLGQLTWSAQSAPAGTPTLNADVVLPGNNTVWAVGNNCTLLFTADSGFAWQTVPAPSGCNGSDLQGIYFQDPNHGWAVGTGGTILVCSANCQLATATWTVLASDPVPSTTTLNGVWAQDPNDVYVVGASGSGGGVVWACTKNCIGTTATTSSGPPPPPPTSAVWGQVVLSGINLSSSGLNAVDGQGNEVVAAGAAGTVIACSGPKCDTAGANTGWSTLAIKAELGTSVTLNSVFAADANDLYITGHGPTGGIIWACSSNCTSTVIGTGPGQATWTDVTPAGSFTNLYGMTGGTPNTAWAVGQGGTIWLCVTACSSNSAAWTSQTSSALSTADLFAVAATNNGQYAWAVGANGTILFDDLNPPAPSAPAQTCPNKTQAANPSGGAESLIANPSPASGATVNAGSTFYALYADEQTLGSATSTTASPTVTLSGTGSTTYAATTLGATATATSALTPTYVDQNGGSESSNCEDSLSFSLPTTLSPGTYAATMAAYDSDGNHDTFTWNVTVVASPAEPGGTPIPIVSPPPPPPGPACNGNAQAANPTGHTESLIANPSPATGATLNPGASVYSLYTDDQPMATTNGATASPTVKLAGSGSTTYASTTLTPTVVATSGQTPTYVDANGGSTSTACEDSVAFALPSNLAAGTYTATATVYDSDNDHDTYAWNITVVTSPTEPGGTPIPIVAPQPTSQVINSLVSALADLDTALNPALWPGCDADHILPTGVKGPLQGQQVFQNLQQAIQQLQNVPQFYLPTGDTALTTEIATIVSRARLIASTAIGDAQAAGDSVTQAQQSLANGDTQNTGTNPNPGNAVNQYGQAWQQAEQAMGNPTQAPDNCGLSDSLSGNPIITGTIEPGQTIANKTVTITNTGADESVITLTEANITHSTSACPAGVNCPAGFSTGNLAHDLVLTITDTSNANKLIYSGAFDSLPSTQICAIGSPSNNCEPWINNEAHTLSFTVAMPNHGPNPGCTDNTTLTSCPDNAYQATGASAEFDWTRTS